MNLKKIRKICIFTILAVCVSIPVISGCGKSTAVSLESLYEANTTAAILQNHSSFYEEITYHENLDDEITFQTSYCYNVQEDGKNIYQTEGQDASDSSSDDNFSYYIVDNIEYSIDNNGTATIYPLSESYIEDFKSNSLTVSTDDSGELSSTSTKGAEIILTCSADPDDTYDSDTLESFNSLCNDTITDIKTIYIADADTLLLTKVKKYYVGESGKEYLFSEGTVTYDETEPDLSDVDRYINADSTRTITVIEKSDAGDTSNLYTIPANITPNYECFISNGYTLYNDADGLDPYNTEAADSSGNYQNVTLYAINDSDTNQNTEN